MEITLNGEKMDITLEKEKNLREVLEGVENWLSREEWVLRRVRINGTLLETTEQGLWPEKPLAEIQNIALEAASSREIRLESIETTMEYLSMLRAGLKEKDVRLLGDLKEGFPYMRKSLFHLFNRKGIPAMQEPNPSFLNVLDEGELFTPGGPAEERIKGICEHIDRLLVELKQLAERETDPLQELPGLKTDLSASITAINDVSLLLQTGKDREAMDIIIGFTDKLQLLQDIFLRLKKTGVVNLEEHKIAGLSPEKFYTELNSVLKELISAFDVQDYVLIGDLLEYEIAPKMEEIIQFSEKLENNGKGNVQTT